LNINTYTEANIGCKYLVWFTKLLLDGTASAHAMERFIIYCPTIGYISAVAIHHWCCFLVRQLYKRCSVYSRVYHRLESRTFFYVADYIETEQCGIAYDCLAPYNCIHYNCKLLRHLFQFVHRSADFHILFTIESYS
jgi:hypothetical protein